MAVAARLERMKPESHSTIYDFDTVIPRRGTDSFKWSSPDSVLPLPVADMDFLPPPEVTDALQRRLDHGVFGYAMPPASLIDALLGAMARDYGWRIEPEWVSFLPGVVPMLQHAARMLDPGAPVITFTPVYPPFLSPQVLCGHPQIRVPIAKNASGYVMDFDALEHATRGARGGLLFWCHPQNPTGRCFTRAELERLADFCLRHDLLIASDEIHCDLILEPDRRHIPMASLDAEVARRTMVFMAPSKTYNIPGLCTAFAIIPDPDLRRRFRSAEPGMMPPVNVMGYAACEAAYRHGRPWLAALIEYLRANRDHLSASLADLPSLRMNRVEATYLAWLDCHPGGIRDPHAFFMNAGLALSDGAAFGAPGFVRLNFGCPRSTLDEAIARMRKALT